MPRGNQERAEVIPYLISFVPEVLPVHITLGPEQFPKFTEGPVPPHQDVRAHFSLAHRVVEFRHGPLIPRHCFRCQFEDRLQVSAKTGQGVVPGRPEDVMECPF